MTLSHLDILCLRAADGLATGDEEASLVAEGVDPAAWRELRIAVAEALDPGPLPDIAADVMAALGLDDPDARTGDLLRQVLGVASPPDLAQAVMAALDLDDGVPALRRALALAVEGDDPPDLADAVLARLELDDGHAALARALRRALDGGSSPELAQDVLSRLGLVATDDLLRDALLDGAGDLPDLAGAVLRDLSLADATDQARTMLREDHDLAMAEAPDLVPEVMALVGAEDGLDGLGDLLLAGSEPVPDLWADIAGALDISAAEPAAPAPAAEVVPLRRERRPWRLAAAGLAAAAALLVVFTGVPETSREDAMAFELSDINHVEIEDLSTDAEAIVQVFQFDEEAPPIIFIDVLDESADPIDLDAEGATL